ncbi:MAG: cellulase family glycosylhydrolase [Flavisolibacter sp.]
MKKKCAQLSFIILFFLSAALGQSYKPWSTEKANNWYKKQAWVRGANFIPHTAINQLEMWQEETFDTLAINYDLGLAQSIGFNSMRVFLHHLAWQQDPEGFKSRIKKYLSIASSHKIATILVFFDDCWNDDYHSGTQPKPKPGVHNSGWLRDPGSKIRMEPLLQDTLEKYVKNIISEFKHDRRILLWDLYNEPGNSNYGDSSLDLVKKIFSWGKEINPDQPLSFGVWNEKLVQLNAYQLSHSDIITYHNYNKAEKHQQAIDTLKKRGRPLICTEYMARRNNSLFSSIMPVLKREHIGAINWGLVSGKTNTIYAWDTPMPDGKEPTLWFHDIFRPNGEPFSKEEVLFLKKITGVKK